MLRTPPHRLASEKLLGPQLPCTTYSVGTPHALVPTELSQSYPWSTEKALLLQDLRPPLRTSASKLQEIQEKTEPGHWKVESVRKSVTSISWSRLSTLALSESAEFENHG